MEMMSMSIRYCGETEGGMEGQCHQGKACEVHPSRDGSMDRNAMFCFFCGVFLAESCSLQDVSSLIRD